MLRRSRDAAVALEPPHEQTLRQWQPTAGPPAARIARLAAGDISEDNSEEDTVFLSLFFLCIRMVSSFIFCRWFFIEIPFLFLCSEPVSFGNRRRRWSSVASSWRPCSSCASTRWRPTLAIWPPWRRCCWRRCCSRATPSSASASSAASSCCGVSTPSSASGSSPSLLSSASSSWMYVF